MFFPFGIDFPHATPLRTASIVKMGAVEATHYLRMRMDMAIFSAFFILFWKRLYRTCFETIFSALMLSKSAQRTSSFSKCCERKSAQTGSSSLMGLNEITVIIWNFKKVNDAMVNSMSFVK
jgi:hypothetical protein